LGTGKSKVNAQWVGTEADRGLGWLWRSREKFELGRTGGERKYQTEKSLGKQST